MGTKLIIETLDAVDGKIVVAAKQLGDFMKIEAKEQVLHDLGIEMSGITAEIVGNT